MNRYERRAEVIRKAEAGELELDAEEQAIEESFDRGEFKSIPNVEAEIKRYQEAARATLRKDKRVNIRMTSRDLEAIQVRAIEEGIPYQTLMASVLHKYVTGRLVEKSSR